VNLSLPLFDDWPLRLAEAPVGARPGGRGGAAGQGTDVPAAPDPATRGPGQAEAGEPAVPSAVDHADHADHADSRDGRDEGLPDPAADRWPSERLLEPPDPAQWHPALWRASQVGGGRQRTTPSGFEPLDAQLPGGGWPHGVLTELLLAQPGIGELRLLAPTLARLAPPPSAGAAVAVDETARCVMLFDPPARLSAWALAQQGLHTRHWLVVQPRTPQRHPRAGPGLAPLLPAADLLWALEQALRSGHVGAVLAWLPRSLRADALRRLQLAAQAHDGPVFVFREAQAAGRPSAAPLRLLLQPAGIDGLALRLLKRRGPPLGQVLRLQLPPVLTPRQHAQAATRQLLGEAHQAAMQAAKQVVVPG